MFEVLELIETCAGRSEQYDFTGFRLARGMLHGGFESPALNQRQTRAQWSGNLFRRRAEQQNAPSLLFQTIVKQSVIAVLVLAAQNDPQTAGKRVERLDGGIDIRRLRIVVIPD